MNVQVRQEDGVDIVELLGSLDGKTAPEVKDQLQPVLSKADKLILDMSGVDYLSSAGLRLLLLAYREITSRKGKVVLLGVSKDIQTVMSHTGFLGFFTLADSREQAAQAVA
jgi:anti-sigma B factor antagonist